MDKIVVRSIQEVLVDADKTIRKIEHKYKDTDFYLDVKLAEKIIKFISMLKHTGGALGGKNFQLLPFQVEFIIEVLAVLQKRNDYRKHTRGILFVPRKQGKTELLSAMNLWMYFGDKEIQKEQYVIASETQQATILYAAIVSMVKQAPYLFNKVNIFKSTKTIETKDAAFPDIFKVLSATADTKDGLKGSLITADEAHAYKDSALFDVMTESMAHREQPLTIIITTAGHNKQGFFKRLLDYAKQVMDGIIVDNGLYLMDYSLNEDEDDWKDEKNWIKVNPALGYGVKMDYLRDKFIRACHSATEEVSFKTKHLCMWVDSAITWIKSEDWNKSNKKGVLDESDYVGRECYGGLDLSSTTDITAFVLVFPNGDGSFDVLSRFFIPSDNAIERSRTDKVSYLDWIKEGWITTTQGNVVDYKVLEEHIRNDAEKFDIREIAFDRWNASSIVTNLEQDGLTMVGFGQGYKSMSSPVKEIEALVLQEKLNHGDNPALTWMVANVQIIQDAADNVKMDKSKAIERIDGAVALAMAIGRASVYVSEEVDFDSLIG